MELPQLGQTVDQCLGDAVAQVFRLRIAADIHEGQNSQRINRFAQLLGARGCAQRVVPLTAVRPESVSRFRRFKSGTSAACW